MRLFVSCMAAWIRNGTFQRPKRSTARSFYLLSLLSSYRVFYFSFLPPEFFKPGWIGGGIADGVLDVAMAEVVLNQPGIRTLIG